MALKQPGRKIYTTANGKHIDLDLLISRNELTPAVGNARVNARGDELGPGGKIVRKKEDILKDYYDNATSVKSETVVRDNKTVQDQSEDWEEDEDGNFIKKGK